MGIFSSISKAIFGRPAEPRATAQAGTPAASGSAVGSIFTGAATQAQQAGAQAQTVAETDVIATLEARAAGRGERLNWRSSIVDLMKLLDIDSSLDNRKELARELGYTGDLDGSAEMNIWLHKKTMQELAANGGRVPAELTD